MDEATCWACSKKALALKQLCESCLKDAARDLLVEARKVKHYIKSAVKDGLRHVLSLSKHSDKAASSSPDDSEAAV